MPKFPINFTDDQVAKLGGCKTQTDFQAAVDSMIAESGAPKTEQKVVLLSDVENIFKAQIGTFTASVKTVTDKFEATENAVKAIDPVALKAACVEASEKTGSLAAAKALGKVGASGAGSVPSEPSEGAEAKTGSAALIAEGKYEEAFAADANIRKEFLTAKDYAGFMKLQANGQVKISGRK